MNKHDRYNRSEKGRARWNRYAAKRVLVMGERIAAPNIETRDLMRQLRDDRKAAHG